MWICGSDKKYTLAMTKCFTSHTKVEMGYSSDFRGVGLHGGAHGDALCVTRRRQSYDDEVRFPRGILRRRGILLSKNMNTFSTRGAAFGKVLGRIETADAMSL
jgi:hypothetical protein